MNITVEELKEFNGGCEWCKNQEGYRIIYFYSDNTYKMGNFCENIEVFMMDFVEVEPIEDESDIPDFISVEDLLN